MIEAKTATELADHIERELAKVQDQPPSTVLVGVTTEQIKWIIEALRRLRVLRSTSHG